MLTNLKNSAVMALPSAAVMMMTTMMTRKLEDVTSQVLAQTTHVVVD